MLKIASQRAGRGHRALLLYLYVCTETSNVTPNTSGGEEVCLLYPCARGYVGIWLGMNGLCCVVPGFCFAGLDRVLGCWLFADDDGRGLRWRACLLRETPSPPTLPGTPRPSPAFLLASEQS